MNAVHRFGRMISLGRLGNTLRGMPVVELTTIGRTSGLERPTLLTSPLQRGESYFVVASRGGDDKTPAWLLNLEANPAVRVAIGDSEPGPWTARVLSSEERAEVWPVVTKAHPHYAGYQRRTAREIPLVELTPAG
jgi:deazaflavin-dependent oxidoreductase (nitroreductase family)